MKTLATALGALLTGTVLLAGCGGGDDEPADPTGTTDGRADRSTTGGVPAPALECDGDQWLAAWGASQSDLDTVTPFAGRTMRMIVVPHASGETVRVRFSNRLSGRPLRVATPTIATADPEGGAGTADAPVALRFGGRDEVTLSPGEVRLSDPARLAIEPFAPLAISAFLPGDVDLGRHIAALETSYLSAPGAGNLSASADADGFDQPFPSTLLIDRVEVRADRSASELVAFGDSLVEGFGSPSDADERFTDFLQLRIDEAGQPVSVLNAGIGSNQLTAAGIVARGAPGVDRFARDALAYPDARTVIVSEGINDIASGVSSGDLIAAIENVAEQAEQAGAGLQIATVAPTDALTETEEAQRQELNDWIRSSSGLPIADFDRALRDPEEPARLAAELDSGDGLHPNAAGHERMAEAIDLADLPAADCGATR